MVILWCLIGYLIGSIPFGIVIARAMGLGNLRNIGSGNIGATNVLRTGNKKAAALTLLFDAGKGAMIVLLARAFAGEDAAQIAGLAAFFSPFIIGWIKQTTGSTDLGMYFLASFTVIGAILVYLIPKDLVNKTVK